MLHEFLSVNREEIIARTRAKVANRPVPRATEAELENGIPLFLTQLIDMLQSPATELGAAAIGESAARHGDEMRRMGFTVGQIVHDYGGLCQAITELAVEKSASIGSAEFKVLNGCLDDAVAFAVTEFSRQREQSIVNQGVEHLGILAHEMRNALNTAVLAFSALQSGVVGTNGSTSTVVLRSMARMRELLDRSFAEVRLKAGIQKRTQVLVSAIIEEVGSLPRSKLSSAAWNSWSSTVPANIVIHADPQILVSAFSNLIQKRVQVHPPHGPRIADNPRDCGSGADPNRG